MSETDSSIGDPQKSLSFLIVSESATYAHQVRRVITKVADADVQVSDISTALNNLRYSDCDAVFIVMEKALDDLKSLLLLLTDRAVKPEVILLTDMTDGVPLHPTCSSSW